MRPFLLKAFQVALQAARCTAETTLFLDDNKRNIEGAASVGIDAVLVGTLNAGTSAVAEIDDLHSLPAALPHLWPSKQPQEKGTTIKDTSTRLNVSQG